MRTNGEEEHFSSIEQVRYHSLYQAFHMRVHFDQHNAVMWKYRLSAKNDTAAITEHGVALGTLDTKIGEHAQDAER